MYLTANISPCLSCIVREFVRCNTDGSAVLIVQFLGFGVHHTLEIPVDLVQTCCTGQKGSRI